MFSNNLLMAAAGGGDAYVIENSVLLNNDDSAYMSRTFSGAADSTTTYTLSLWFKRGNISLGATTRLLTANGVSDMTIGILSDDTLTWSDQETDAPYDTWYLTTTQVLRDPAAWYNLVLCFDSTNGTAGNRMRMWLNGVEVTDFDTDTNPDLNANSAMGSAIEHFIGSWNASLQYFDGYISEFVYLDGTAVTDATDFGEFDNQGYWKPIDVTGLTFGTNGFLLDFADSSHFGKNAAVADPTAYVPVSVHFDGSADYLNRGAGLTGAADSKTGIISLWYKPEAGATSQFFFGEEGYVTFNHTTTTNVVAVSLFNSDGVTAALTMSSATGLNIGVWNHIVASWDTATSTAQFYLNGVSSVSIGTQNDLTIDYTRTDWAIGAAVGGTNKATGDFADFIWDDTHIDLSIAENLAKFITADGYPVDPGSDGSTAIGASPLIYLNQNTLATWHTNAGTGGGFTENGALTAGSTVRSAKSNDFTDSGLTASDQVSDTPTNDADNDVGNYCTLNPLDKNATKETLSNGNLTTVGSTPDTTVRGTMTLGTTGKWYWEMTAGSASGIYIGAVLGSKSWTVGGGSTSGLNNGWMYNVNGKYYGDGNGSGAAYGDSYTTNDIIGVAYDATSGTIWFSKNDTWQNSATQGEIEAGTTTNAAKTGIDTSVPIYPATCDASNSTRTMNFGQLGFAGTVPTGFKALATQNMPTPAIPDPTKHFQTALVTHNGTTAAVTCNWDMDVSDTIILAKNRDATEIWYMADGLQGYDKYNQFSTTTQTTDGNVFSVSGTTLTMGSTFAANDYIVYFIKAGAAGGAANSDGSITTTVSANTTAGVSIVIAPSGTNTSKTFGHGLGVTPTAMWVKPNTGASNWSSWWTGLTGPTYDLNITASAVQGANNVYASQGATTYGSGSWSGLNVELSNYCFTDIPGFLKTGVFEGNGNVDGSFIYCGFRPALVIIASIDSGSPFAVYDNLREGYNVDNDRLDLVSTGAEGTADEIDLLSNGFKLRIATDPNVAETSIFIAFADTPIQGSKPASNTSQGRAR